MGNETREVSEVGQAPDRGHLLGVGASGLAGCGAALAPQDGGRAS